LGRLRRLLDQQWWRCVQPHGEVDPCLAAGAQAPHIDAEELTPNELIAAILRAPVDLLWNGGVGTYVKASTESNAEVGDRANDVLRVNGNELRCRIVGEGGNLGFTQRGRVEFALSGGLINTDAIDNSAGVDCSDHEVNIKILLNALMRRGELDFDDRNALLAEMTDDVAQLVLEDNRLQTIALAMARKQAYPMINVHARYLHALESEGLINRALEALPTDRQLTERQANGIGLTAPEFAVLLAYTKNTNVAEINRGDLATDDYLEADLVATSRRRCRLVSRKRSAITNCVARSSPPKS
jgi:glutamate dehydrogenase